MRDIKFCLLVLVFFVFTFLSLPLRCEASASVIKVGVYNNPPKVFINKDGKPDGIFIDVIKAVAKNENINVKYVVSDWNSLIAKLNKNEIDVLPDMAYSVERDTLFTFGQLPVLESWLEVFVRPAIKISSVSDLENMRIGVLQGSIQEVYLRESVKTVFNIDFDLQSFDTYERKINELRNENIDIVVADRFFYYSDLYDDDIRSTSIILRPTYLHFVFNKKNGAELACIFDKNISNLKNNAGSEYYISLNKWLDKHYHLGMPMYIKWLLIFIGFILLVIGSFTLLLRNRVKAKTKELEEKNQELMVAIEKAQESDKLKSAFLTNLSHEIRTPMNGVLGFLELIKNPNLSEKTKGEYSEIVKKSSLRLLKTMNDIVEVSKIESKQIIVNPTVADVNAIIESCRKNMEALAEEKGLEFKIGKLIPDDSSIIKVDKAKLETVLCNLVNNAIKFTENGNIEIGNYIENQQLYFFVKDTGPGISEESFISIFNYFVQADNEISRSYEGAGLGLSIAKAYVEIMGGKIALSSEAGKGSIFIFYIPYEPAKSN